MKIGFLFPGQGSQTVGMGKDLYDKFESYRNVYNEVKNLTGLDVAKITFEGPEELLNQTKYTQICILTMSLAILELLKENNINAEISCGLSLGEYSSLIYSKALDFEEGIKLVQKRGEYMQELAPSGEWAMASILGSTEEVVQEICDKVTDGFVVPVNFNTTGNTVISGEKKGVDQAETIAKEMGIRKVVRLNTSGPFHTEKLIDSSNALRKELENVKFNDFETQVVKNIDGTFYKSSDDIKDILARHIISPVRFSTSLKTMLDSGVDTFIEVGPGKTLSGFIKRLEKENEVTILNVNNVETFENVVNTLK